MASLSYVAVPLGIGTLVGWASSEGRRWGRWVTGPNPAPRAWDHLFQGRREGWIRLRLKSGVWLGGAFVTAPNGLSSYSAGYPEVPDLYLAMALSVDADTGEFQLGDTGAPLRLGSGLLVRWEEIEYLELIDESEVGRAQESEGSASA